MTSLPTNHNLISAISFAQNGDKTENIPTSESQREMNWATGFPKIFSQPLDEQGKFVKREDMNAILYALSNAIMFIQKGGLVSFDQNLCNAINGYPLGARLWFTDSSNNIRMIESTQPDNTVVPSKTTIDIAYTDGKTYWKSIVTPANYLPLSGGTMTGGIALYQRNYSNKQYPEIAIGAGTAWNKNGAAIVIRSDTHETQESRNGFEIFCPSPSGDGTYISLFGKTNGNLTWGNKQIIRSENNVSSISIVDSLPSTPSSSMIYFVKG